MEYEFSTRSRFVTPTFFGGGFDGGDATAIAAGDAVETWIDTIRVKVRLETVDGDAMSGTVEEMEDDYRKLTEHEGLSVGTPVSLRNEHVRKCWKRAA